MTEPPTDVSSLPPRALLYARAFAVAVGFHLALPDTHGAGWLWPDLLLGAGAALLAWRGLVRGWLLCFAGLLWPLLLLRDPLTQSTYLMLCAAGALLSAVGSRDGRASRLSGTHPAVVRVLTAGLYSAAVFHKLNTSFLDPTTSCANGGLVLLGGTWSFDLASLAAFPYWPGIFLVVESLVALLYVARPRIGLLLALLMHLPLTIVFAPAFAIVALSGWVCALGDDDLRALYATWRERRAWVLGLGLGFSALSFGLYLRDHWVIYPAWQLTEVVVWLGLSLTAFTLHREVPRWGRAWGAWRSRPPRLWLPAVFALAWLAWIATPYLGVNMHHTGAMLSNLRVDGPCWNSVVVPSSVRSRDPYLRVESVSSAGTGLHDTGLVGAVLSAPDLERALVPICAQGPVSLTVIDQGTRRRIPDACRAWPYAEPWLPGYARYRTELTTTCRQVCVH